ncbi:type I restriction enzyme HsdR N-terminal domain-containing protein [Spiroplasma sp. ald]|uniref:type I restriction enzyme HsdR N-terminal domain-containing protein n=1 Tax=Spiroplasma sp. ald TaxID=2490849 RepID=UPI0037DC9850
MKKHDIKEKIIDFISGKEILFTPEELDAVQPLSKELVGIFGYNKNDIITKPQYEVSTPSEGKKYPVDIAVFENGKVKIIVECKNKNKNEGINQLKKYLSLSEANFGIWFNGIERKYFKKIIKNGKIFDYKEINSIPMKGIEDEQWLIKSQLKEYDDLKSIFKEIHSYISAHIVSSTSGFSIAENLIKVLFCKIYDERYKENNKALDFFL